jgi:hypothetical protein
METYFQDFDFTNFWNDSVYALKAYVEAPPSGNTIKLIETELGYTLPASYVALMKMHNGGIPVNTCYPTLTPTSWAADHVAISGIMGIGREKANSIGGSLGSKFMIQEWGYPDIGVCICDCPSAGHDMIMLDYSKNGPDGEPEVVHIDQELDYAKTVLAPNFEAFIRGLVNAAHYDTSAADYLRDQEKVKTGTFSPLLTTLCAAYRALNPAIDQTIRRIALQILEQKKHFILHADELSLLMYDIQFLLYTHLHPVTTKSDYLKNFSKIIALSGEFNTGGYAPGFVTDWFAKRIANQEILDDGNSVAFSTLYKAELLSKIASL